MLPIKNYQADHRVKFVLEDITKAPVYGGHETGPAMHVTGNLDPVLIVKVNNGLGSKDYYQPVEGGKFVWIARN